jgi:hypothetical protein
MGHKGKKIFNVLKKGLKLLYKVGLGTAGVTSIKGGAALTLVNPILGAPAIVAGVVATGSAISSAVKDKDLGPLAEVVKWGSGNIDYADNDPQKNYK